jgi:endonuclease/exonuclease/phosphatase family metal-dependent hydrolase
MSYNIHVGQDENGKDQLKEMAAFMKASGADIIGLQEVDSVCNRSGNVDEMKVLSEMTGMYYAYGRHFAFDGGSYGLGILSRYPISHITNDRITVILEGKRETRAMVSATITVGKKALTFTTVHMDYRDHASRVNQSLEMLDILKRKTMPVILTGDFNAEPATPELDNLRGFFTDVSSEGMTYPVLKPIKKIDYIMVDKAHLSKASAKKVFPVLYSDHLPVMSTVKLRR